MARVDAALQHAILDESSDLVVDEGRHDCGAKAEAPSQSARDVVLAAAFPDPERSSVADPSLTRIEPQHHLTERDDVEARICGHAMTARPIASAVSRVTAFQLRSARSFDATIQLPPIASTGGSRR